MKPLLTCLLFTSVVFAQESLPVYGNMSDLRGMTKVYLATESTQIRKYVLDELKKNKTLEVVNSPDVAQFFLECKETGQTVIGGSLIKEIKTFEMTAYTLIDKHRRIAWSGTKNSLRYPPSMLTRDFLKELKKIK